MSSEARQWRAAKTLLYSSDGLCTDRFGALGAISRLLAGPDDNVEASVFEWDESYGGPAESTDETAYGVDASDFTHRVFMVCIVQFTKRVEAGVSIDCICAQGGGRN
jgi:hypothetical protein